jgi:hypothetical protein
LGLDVDMTMVKYIHHKLGYNETWCKSCNFGCFLHLVTLHLQVFNNQLKELDISSKQLLLASLFHLWLSAGLLLESEPVAWLRITLTSRTSHLQQRRNHLCHRCFRWNSCGSKSIRWGYPKFSALSWLFRWP